MFTTEDRWLLINSLIKEQGLIDHHLESFNHFLEHDLQKAITSVNDGKIEVSDQSMYVKIEKIRVGAPSVREADGTIRMLYPQEARIRNLTYAAPLELHLKTMSVYTDPTTNEKRDLEGDSINVFAGYLPIMLKSKKCYLHNLTKEELIKVGEDPMDLGGYFIINGSERVLVSQEDLAPNKILITPSKSSQITASTKIIIQVDGYRSYVKVNRLSKGDIQISFPGLSRPISVSIVLKALGLEKPSEIISAIMSDPELESRLVIIIEAGEEVTNQEEALDYIGKRVAIGQNKAYRISRATALLNNNLLPNLGRDDSEETRMKKAYFIAHVVQRLLEYEIGKRKEDDRDHYANKRLNLSGDLMLAVFRNAFQALCKDIKYQLERAFVRGRSPAISTAIRADVITDRLKHSLATGNWLGGRTGVSQILDRTNYMSQLSHLRRIVSPLSRTQQHFEARDLHPTQWGKICPSETPEGPNCGLVKNMALLATVSKHVDEKKVINIMKQLGMITSYKASFEKTTVFLNNLIVGHVENPVEFVKEFRSLRRKGQIDQQVNIVYYKDTNEIYVNADPGRLRRPLIVVENGKPLLEKKHLEQLRKGKIKALDLVYKGVIEYLDADEEENAYIALNENDLTPEHTHLEISPATILGVAASIIPYPEHNRSDRNVYEGAMAKQALGFYAANFKWRMDTRSHLLHYPQKPLVITHAMEVINYLKRPAGQNFIIALLSYDGYNMEDAIVFNKGSIERGLGRSTFFRTYEAEEKKLPGGQEDRFEIPKPDVRGYKSEPAYRFLSEDGLVEPERELSGNSGDVLIGRTSPPRFLEEYGEYDITARKRRETSISMRHGETGISDTVILTQTSDGTKLAKVKVRSERVPELGDKFASRHGQKGVIGLLVNEADMPFTMQGITPDILLNPHAIPSRMTVGQLIEMIAGKAAALSGKPVYGTVFENETTESLSNTLKRLGFHPMGREKMFDGKTGRMLDVDVFIGITYYQKLHHLVKEKIHARARGSIQILTRQPTEGRAREGGLRFGEMERDVLVGHGASILLKERLLDESDKITAYVCEKCHHIAYYNKFKDKLMCPICKDNGKIYSVEMSYAFKLLLQELMSLGIAPRILLDDKGI